MIGFEFRDGNYVAEALASRFPAFVEGARSTREEIAAKLILCSMELDATADQAQTTMMSLGEGLKRAFAAARATRERKPAAQPMSKPVEEKPEFTPPRLESHIGEDYAVLMLPDEGTEDACVQVFDGYGWSTERLVNFLAAAPDMYEALRAWENWYDVDSSEENRERARDLGLAALQKASGK